MSFVLEHFLCLLLSRNNNYHYFNCIYILYNCAALAAITFQNIKQFKQQS